MSKIIGISGRIGNGKTFIANKIVERYPHVRIVSFATELKRLAAMAGGYNVDDSYTQEGKQKIIPWLGMTIREFLQKYGIAIRDVDVDFWVKKLQSMIRYGETFIVDDLRFPNEFRMCKENGLTVRVTRYLSFDEWRDLLGIGENNFSFIRPFNDGLISIKTYIDIVNSYRHVMRPKQLKILDSLCHTSETALDDHNFGCRIKSIKNKELDLTEIYEFIEG